MWRFSCNLSCIPNGKFWTLPKLKRLQMTNFMFFERRKVLQRERKHCGKWRNCSLQVISPFPTLFSKDLNFRHIKTRACLVKGQLRKKNIVYLFTTQSQLLMTLKKKPCENIIGKGENLGTQHFLLFPQCFLPFPKHTSLFKSELFCPPQSLSILTSPKLCHSVKSYSTIILFELTFYQVVMSFTDSKGQSG